MNRHIADEQASRILVEGDWAAENARHEGAEARQRDEAASIFQQEVRRKIVIGAADAGAGFSGCEFAFQFVVAEFPVQSVGSGADWAEGFEDFEQSDVFVAIALQNRERIVGCVGVDSDALFFGRAVNQKGRGEEDCDREPTRRDETPPRPPAGLLSYRRARVTPAHKSSVHLITWGRSRS